MFEKYESVTGKAKTMSNILMTRKRLSVSLGYRRDFKAVKCERCGMVREGLSERAFPLLFKLYENTHDNEEK